MGIPLNVAGWGPREGVAAWAFAAAGLGAAQGVSTAVVYGVMALVASLPGRCWCSPATGCDPVVGAARPAGGGSMADRPYTVLSCGMSIDGYLDDASGERLVLSNEADLDRVDEVRAGCDAILVGAATVRNDNPRLLVRTAARRADRVARGLPPSPVKVTVTRPRRPRPEPAFFRLGDGEKLVYCASEALGRARGRGSGTSRPCVDAGLAGRPAPGQRGPATPAGSAG